MKDCRDKIIFTDKLTGKNLAVITFSKWRIETMADLFTDIIINDFNHLGHGVDVTYGEDMIDDNCL